MEYERIKLRGIQKKIAEKMVKSKTTIPHVTTIREVRMDTVVRDRERIKALLGNKNVSYLAFITKAATDSLKDFPLVNSSFDEIESEIIIKKDVNIGLAVSVDDKLLVPVVKKADCLSFVEIIVKINELINKTRSGLLTSEDFQEGTFTITNSGTFGGEIFTPIINYPESAILGIGKIKKKPIVNENNEIIICPMMYLCLSYDHRIINGVTAVKFLGGIEENLQKEVFLDN
jgi:pyruvate dehydrogenase E2 component (dihydrolipoamide acetyltransferase)